MPPHEGAFEGVSPEQADKERALVAALLRRAHRARQHPADFFDFTMREEFGERRRVRVVPHQRVLYEFVLAHQHCVVRIPVGTAKTYTMSALGLWLLGRDPTERGAVISETLEQAEKPVGMVRDYVENKDGAFPELRLVFPKLRPSPRISDPWTRKAFTVDRPAGIRDPSLQACGIEGGLVGSRLSWILVDDVLSLKNTRTAEGRKKVISQFNTVVLSRRDVGTARVVVTNTPWHPQDLTYALENAGWPTLTMDIDGGILITNADDWDSDHIRPAYRTRGEYHRLVAHDSERYGAPIVAVTEKGRRVEANASHIANGSRLERFDIDETIPLWPEKYSRDAIASLVRQYAGAMHEFNQLYRCICRDDETARCKVEWIERCKDKAKGLGYHSLVSSYSGSNLTVTGVDLAIGRGKANHLTSLFTYEVVPGAGRRILDIDFGRWKGREIIDKIKQKAHAYGSLVRVESNAAQDFIRQWVLDDEIGIPIRAHYTGQNKHHPSHGVESIFIAMENGAWLIPNDANGVVHSNVQKWIEECLQYQPPPAHTGDVLMSAWLATEQEREIMRGAGGPSAEQGSLASSLLAR